MKKRTYALRCKLVYLSGTALLSAVYPSGACAQSGEPQVATAVPAPVPQDGAGIADIVVTAQKRSQSINSVGISITAATGDALQARGVRSGDDLAKVVPGFTFAPSPYSTPVYTIRGIGLYDSGLASSPAVATYVDEVSIPFPAMSTGATLDLERVEVLKGPQGTLFGQNSTGGAINYIAAKPTDHVAAGASVSYERFGLIDASGYLSGPISDTLRARVAVRGISGGEWQYSLTRPEDRRGATRQLMGRLLADWDPSDSLAVRLNVNGFRDRSDTQAEQFTENIFNITEAGDPNNPNAIVDPVRYTALTDPSSPRYDASFASRQALEIARLQGVYGPLLQQLTAATLAGPIAPNNARAADWTPEWPHQLDKKYYQASLRADYNIGDGVKLTSITAYQRLNSNVFQDLDASAAASEDVRQFGIVSNFDQELRLSGKTRRLNWLLGGSYDLVRQNETEEPHFIGETTSQPAPGFLFSVVDANLKQTVKTYAAFANAEYEIIDHLTLQAGIRYTEDRHRAATCDTDVSQDQGAAAFFSAISGVHIGPGQCFQLNSSFAPVLTPDIQHLNEHSVSWKFGATYKFDGGTLLYANESRGYKAGVFGTIVGAFAVQSAPAVQERVDATEAGFKAPLADHRLQLNGSVFYDSYQSKQIRARIVDPTFGLLEKLINVPKSRVWGLEGEIIAAPTRGLNLSLSGTYIQSKITSNDPTKKIYNQEGYYGTFYGSSLPYTPTFTGIFDAQYEWSIGSSLKASVGADVNRHSASNATPGTSLLLNDEYKLNAYTTLDLRAGLGAQDGRWQLSLFGRNVTNEYIVTTSFTNGDIRYRYAARPVTYGVRLSFKFD